MGRHFPAMTLLVVSGLAEDDALVEIEADRGAGPAVNAGGGGAAAPGQEALPLSSSGLLARASMPAHRAIRRSKASSVSSSMPSATILP